jgi:hypothetical protein
MKKLFGPTNIFVRHVQSSFLQRVLFIVEVVDKNWIGVIIGRRLNHGNTR